jgi:hypothetical protein
VFGSVNSLYSVLEPCENPPLGRLHQRNGSTSYMHSYQAECTFQNNQLPFLTNYLSGPSASLATDVPCITENHHTRLSCSFAKFKRSAGSTASALFVRTTHERPPPYIPVAPQGKYLPRGFLHFSSSFCFASHYLVLSVICLLVTLNLWTALLPCRRLNRAPCPRPPLPPQHPGLHQPTQSVCRTSTFTFPLFQLCSFQHLFGMALES